jgi:hypothetical protein
MGLYRLLAIEQAYKVVVMCFWSSFCDIDYDTDRLAAFTATGRKTISSWCRKLQENSGS